MTSKSLFFKYMKENTKQRLWSVALTVLLCFFAFPVMTALRISIALRPENFSKDLSAEAALTQAKQLLTRDMLNLYSIQNAAWMIFLVVAAVVLAASGFSYLHSKKKTDFYHSLPIRRELLYTVTCLNGILYLAVPYLVFLLAAGEMLQIKGAAFSWGILLTAYAEHMCFFTFVYMTVVLAVILTGNLIVGLLGTGVFFCWGPGVATVITACFSEYFMTFYNDGGFLQRWCERTSPVFWYGTATASDHPARMAAGALAAAVLLFALGMFLYRKRPSEAAGRAMAFRISEPIIRFLLVVPISLFSGLIFKSILNEDIWMVFGLICGLLISSCLIEIIYHFDFKSLFAHKRQLAVSAAAVAAVFLGFRLDVMGFDSYLPDADKIAYAGIYCDSLDTDALGEYHAVPKLDRDGYNAGIQWASQADVADKMHISDEEGIRLLREIGAQGVEAASAQRKYLNSTGQYWTDESDSGTRYDTVLLAWHLKNGKTVYRSYLTVNITALREQLDLIYENEDYKLGMYPVLSFKAEDIAGINYKEEQDCSHVKLPDDPTKAALLAAYQKELMALTPDMRRKESPIAQIQFKTREMQSMIATLRKNGGYYGVFNQYNYYPIYPSFKETIAILEQCKTEVGKKVTPENTDKLVLQYQGGKIPDDMLAPAESELGKRQREYLQGNMREMTITDPEQIAEILSNSVSDDMAQINPMAETYQGISVVVYTSRPEEADMESTEEFSEEPSEENEADQGTLMDMEYTVDEAVDESGQDDIYHRYFYYDKVPESVISTFGLTPDLMRENRVFAY